MRARVARGEKVRPDVKEANVNDENEWGSERGL